jgi:hypothetical protein
MSASEKAFDLEELFAAVFQPRKGEKVMIIADLPHGDIIDNSAWSERRQMALDWQRTLSSLSKALNIKVQPLAFYAATGQNNGDLPENARMEGRTVPFLELFEESDIVLAMTEYSATAPLMTFGRQLEDLRGASMPGVSKRMEETALAADYRELARRTEMLANRLQEAEGARVKFTTGHEFYFDLRYREAKADDGQCPPGAEPPFINLPSGEAYQAPYEGERADDDSRTKGVIPVQLIEEVALLRIEQNRIVEVAGSSPAAEELREFFDLDPARRNIAEIGLGCNEKAMVSGQVLEDEKAGFHWAYGRSEHLGGTVGPDDFSDPNHVVHTDIVYAPESPIGIERLSLEFPEGSCEEIMHDGIYTIF